MNKYFYGITTMFIIGILVGIVIGPAFDFRTNTFNFLPFAIIFINTLLISWISLKLESKF